MEQPSLFDGGSPLPKMEPRAARSTDPGTSAEAAKIPDAPEKFIDILRVISFYSHADFELAEKFPGVNDGTLCKRRLRLQRAGLVEMVPEVHRVTPDNGKAQVFRITKQGRKVLREWQQQVQTSSGPIPPTGEAHTSPSSMPSGPIPASGPCSSGG